MLYPTVKPWILTLLCYVFVFVNVRLCDQHLKVIDGQPKNWTQAVHTCVENGLEIAQPKTEAKSTQLENEFFTALHQNKQQLNITSVWIGLYYDIPTKNYYWEDGTVLDWTNWAGGQPDSKKQSSFICVKVQVSQEFKWTIENCSVQFQVLCENTVVVLNSTSDDVKVINENFTSTSTTESTTQSLEDEDDDGLWPTTDTSTLVVLTIGVLLTFVLIGLGYASWVYFFQNFIEGKPTMRKHEDIGENSPLNKLR